MSDFKLVTDFEPCGDQPEAIRQLVEGVRRGDPHQTLLGVTGSGKSFTIACVVEQINRPTLVMAPNKTLAAQLFSEFKDLFPDNAVEYFVSCRPPCGCRCAGRDTAAPHRDPTFGWGGRSERR